MMRKEATMAGYITKRSKGSYTVAIPWGRDPTTRKVRYVWRSVKGTKREAEALVRDLLRQRDSGVDLPPDKLTVAEYLNQWLTAQQSRVAPRTYGTSCEIALKHIVPKLGAIPLTKLRPAQIDAYLAQARLNGRLDGAGGLSARSVQRHYQVIHAALDRAVKLELIVRNPADVVEVPRAERRVFRTLSPGELTTLLETADSEPNGALVRLAAFTGLRQGELLGLRWVDVDLDAATLSVQQVLQALAGQRTYFRQPKTQTSRRSVALSPATVALLRSHRRRQREEKLRLGTAYADHGLVFQTAVGTPVHPANLRRSWRRIVKRAGIGHLRFHDLRHCHASLLLKQGTHLKVVSERLGHASIAITADLYSHVAPGLQAEAAARFDELLNLPVAAAY
jgi:integrase